MYMHVQDSSVVALQAGSISAKRVTVLATDAGTETSPEVKHKHSTRLTTDTSLIQVGFVGGLIAVRDDTNRIAFLRFTRTLEV